VALPPSGSGPAWKALALYLHKGMFAAE
jgi:hypothetical protein